MPNDPCMPWRNRASGNLSRIVGEGATTLTLSTEWNETSSGCVLSGRLNRMATGKTNSVRPRDIPRRFPSVGAAATLLTRLHTRGAAVLAAWDPLGVFSAAAERMGEHCVSFFGMEVDLTMSTTYPDSCFPLWGAAGPKSVRHDVTRMIYSSSRPGRKPRKLEVGPGASSRLAKKPKAAGAKRPRSTAASSDHGKEKKKRRRSA